MLTGENSFTREEKIMMLSGITPDIFRNPKFIFLKMLYEQGKLSSKDRIYAKRDRTDQSRD